MNSTSRTTALHDHERQLHAALEILDLELTSSKNPSVKMDRTSSEACEGLKGTPTTERIRPRIRASWTRRLP
jgi:hypothetical protein